MSHKKNRCITGETKRSESRDVHQPPVMVIQMSNTALKDGGKSIKCQEGRNQNQDALRGPGLRRFSTEPMRAADVLNPFLVSVQNDNHGGARAGDEYSKKELREHHQCCIEYINDFILPYNRAISEIPISCYVLSVHFHKCVHKENETYQHVEDPEKRKGAMNILCSLDFLVVQI